MSGEAEETLAVLVRIEGRVQGVMYRYWTIQEATRRRLSGWVRNRSDGSVEALFSGTKADVDSMIIACRQGPPAARVTNVVLHAAEIPDRPGFHPLATD